MGQAQQLDRHGIERSIGIPGPTSLVVSRTKRSPRSTLYLCGRYGSRHHHTQIPIGPARAYGSTLTGYISLV